MKLSPLASLAVLTHCIAAQPMMPTSRSVLVSKLVDAIQPQRYPGETTKGYRYNGVDIPFMTDDDRVRLDELERSGAKHSEVHQFFARVAAQRGMEAKATLRYVTKHPVEERTADKRPKELGAYRDRPHWTPEWLRKEIAFNQRINLDHWDGHRWVEGQAKWLPPGERSHTFRKAKVD